MVWEEGRRERELTRSGRTSRRARCGPTGTQPGAGRGRRRPLPWPRAREGCRTGPSTTRRCPPRRARGRRRCGSTRRSGQPPTVSSNSVDEVDHGTGRTGKSAAGKRSQADWRGATRRRGEEREATASAGRVLCGRGAAGCAHRSTAGAGCPAEASGRAEWPPGRTRGEGRRRGTGQTRLRSAGRGVAGKGRGLLGSPEALAQELEAAAHRGSRVQRTTAPRPPRLEPLRVANPLPVDRVRVHLRSASLVLSYSYCLQQRNSAGRPRFSRAGARADHLTSRNE